jgi:hypothetical protein
MIHKINPLCFPETEKKRKKKEAVTSISEATYGFAGDEPRVDPRSQANS